MSQLLTIYNSIVYTNLKAEKLVSDHYKELEQIQNQLKPVKDDTLKYLDSVTKLLDELFSQENITELKLLSSEYRKQGKNAIIPEEIPFPSSKNKFQKFFYFFIRNLNKATLFYLANKDDAELTDEEIKSDIIFFLRDIQSLLSSNIDNPSDENSDYIHQLIALSLFNIYAFTLSFFDEYDVANNVDDIEDLLDETNLEKRFAEDTDKPTLEFISKAREDGLSKGLSPKAMKNQILSFKLNGYKYENLKEIIRQLTLQVDLITEETDEDDLMKLLSAGNINPGEIKIHLGVETTQFRYIVDKLKPMFKKLSLRNIDKSKSFYSLDKNLITESNLSNSKTHNPKQKETIDKIFKDYL